MIRGQCIVGSPKRAMRRTITLSACLVQCDQAIRRTCMFRHWTFLLVWSLLLGHWSFAADLASPLSPADAQQAFVLADSSLRIELAAAEPQVIDPVAIRFDEDGRMWVVEMRDYPLGNPQKGGEPLSRIRVLEDKDNDGRFETSNTFAEKL